jgi:hypothetical protein
VAVNGEKEARIARDGDKPESITVITAHEKSQAQRARSRTDRFPCWTFTTARETLEGPPRKRPLPLIKVEVNALQMSSTLNIHQKRGVGDSRDQGSIGRKIMIPIRKCDNSIG